MKIKQQQREEEILLSLKKCDYLTREQLQKMHRLGKERNAQRVLSSIDGIAVFTDERKNIYYLNKVGRERIGATKARRKTPMINHFLMRNDLYISKGRPSTWKNEVKIKIPNSKVFVVADSVYELNRKYHFVEVDHKQSMSKNALKIKKYRDLQKASPDFVLVWVTATPYRQKKLQELCQGLDCLVYLWDDIK